ncbi:hypothetical protein IV203_003563 [Nitzschia inconspicua]|uniref:Uncharacterized protein n=1 Tax=Nitzschia inconspicua TaxID=303405 RepID=A0A9K3PNT0_9STRA|nr:hypothetical protein IV203_003563 [Nitzschia inconspicua]
MKLITQSIMVLPIFFLLNALTPFTCCMAEYTVIERPWVIECAKSGLAEPIIPLPVEGTPLHQLLYCIVDSALWNDDVESHRWQSDIVNWCFDPYLLTRSCKNDNLDPYKYLFKCLSDKNIPSLNEFPIRYQMLKAVGNISLSPFTEDIIYVEPLIAAACTLLDGFQSPWGVGCLFTYIQSLSEAPSTSPSEAPSTSPSQFPSNSPSFAPSSLPSSKPSSIPSDLPSTSPSMTPSSNPSQVPSLRPTESLSPSSSPSNTPPRYPPIVVQIQILLKFVLKEVVIHLPPPIGFIKALTTGLENILSSKVEGHQAVEIIYVDYVDGTTDLSVIIRATGRRECVECLASELTQEIETGYEETLKSASHSGSLGQQIEFHGFISDIPSLMRVTIDPSSVESIVSVNRNRVVDSAETVSSAPNIVVNSFVFVVGGLAFLRSLM